MSSEEELYDVIENWIKDEISLKEVWRRLSKNGRKLGNLDRAFISNIYSKILLETWFKNACRRAEETIRQRTKDEEELKLGPKHLDLDENDSIEHILQWSMIAPLSGIDRLLLSQKILFEETELWKEYVYRLKYNCRDLYLRRIKAKSNVCSEFSEFFEVFVLMLNKINLHVKRPRIVNSHVRSFLNGDIDPMTFIQRITVSFETVEPKTDLVYSDLIPLELPTNTSSLLKAIVKQLMLPETSINVHKQNELSVIEVRGVSVVLDPALSDELGKYLTSSPVKIEELRIVGLKAVHIKCNLDKSIWHGINISIVTDNLIVHDRCVWNVSGLDAGHRYTQPAASGKTPGGDGAAGEHGSPGESGGNILVVCIQHFNLQNLELVSQGGRGGNGQNGGNGADGKDGENAWKLTKEEFQDKFPSMSYFDGRKTDTNHRKVIRSLESYSGKSFDIPSHDFYIKTEEKKTGRQMIASFYEFFFFFGVRRDSLVWVEGGVGGEGQRGGMGGMGGKGGQGGFHGTVLIKTFDGTSIDGNKSVRGERAESGTDGNAGRGGKNGKQGKAAGDVALLDFVGSGTKDGLFYGFNQDERLHLVFEDCERDGSVWLPAPKEKYARIKDERLPIQQTQQSTREEKVANHKWVQEATKKKAVDKQEMQKNVSQVTQFTEAQHSLMISTQNRMNAVDIGLKDAMETIKMADSQFKEETIKATMQQKELKSKINFIRENEIKISMRLLPETESCQVCDEKCCLAKANDRHINTTGSNRPSPEALVKCLEERSTAQGVDNILHCVFGQANEVGVYTCNDAAQRRANLSETIRQKQCEAQLLQARTVAIRRFASVLDNGNKHPAIYQLKLSIQNVIEQMESFTENLTRPENSHLSQLLLFGNDEESRVDQSQLTSSLENCGPHLVKLMQAITSELAVDEQLLSTEAIVQEYASYVESPLTTLDFPELTLLAAVYQRQIHVYMMQPTLTLVETINPEGDDECYVLLTNKGTWQRLEPNEQRRKLQQHRAHLASGAPKAPEAPEGDGTIDALLNLIQKSNDSEFIRLANKFQYVSVKGLNQHLVTVFTRDGVRLSRNEFRYLLDCLLNATPEDGAIIAGIVSSFCQPRWKQELLLMEMEDAVGDVIIEKPKWRRLLYQINDENLFFLLRDSLSKSDNPSADKIVETLTILAEKLDLNSADYEQLCQLSVEEWCFELKGKYWEKRLQTFQSDASETKSVVYCLLELGNKFGDQFCSEILERCRLKKMDMKSISGFLLQGLSVDDKEIWQKLDTYSTNWYSRLLQSVISSAEKQRSFQELVSIIRNDGNTSNRVKEGLASVEEIIVASKMSETIPSTLKIGFNLHQHLPDFLDLFNEEVKRIYGYHVRDTQLVAITSLLLGKENRLVQVSTGEGKSLIVAAVAIARALSGQHVDVVTSNSVLAVRDSTCDPTSLSIYDIYEAFGISVSNICSHDDDKRSVAYRASVVYGELSYFQKDFLLDTFYDKNIRGDRRFDSVIVDEVDCLLLDRGNNVLYLSHDIPGMETLESLYVFIWEKLCLSLASVSEIKAAVLYDLYGIIQMEDLNRLQPNMSLQDKNALWAHLIQIEAINQRGQVLKPSSQITEGAIGFLLNPEFNARVAYFLRNVADRQRQILIPKDFLPFVDRHLDTVLENAVYALMLNDKQHYIVDQDRTSKSIDLNPMVTIIDADTGTDQAHSQWDGALHQFLQLKERCQLSLQSLKAVFVSNVSYVKKYRHLSGLTGTLGSNPERSYLNSIYETDYFTVPTAFAKKFELQPAQVLGTREKWLAAIVQEIQSVLKSDRSLLIVCKSIQDVEDVAEKLLEAGIKNIHQYVRDYEKLEIASLEPLHVIVATNLAGRGTDIKLSEPLKASGGLHVLTFLPDNVRIEEQAFGRSARNGAPGSGRMIIYQQSPGDSLSDGKIFELKEERNKNELLRISKLEKDFRSNIKIQEMCFDKFSRTFKDIKKHFASFMSKEQSEIVGLCALDSWALWLDDIEPDLPKLDNAVILERLQEELISKLISINQNPKPNEEDWINWFLGWLKSPARLVPLAKHLALSKKTDLADRLFDYLIEKDEFFYPAAHYYKALTIVKKTNLKNEEDKAKFENQLSDAETILRKHAQLYANYSTIVDKAARSSALSYNNIEAYAKQKENMAFLLEIILHSIATLKGAACTMAGLTEHGVQESKADEIFKMLLKHRLINPCGFNLNRETSLKTVCHGYGIPVEPVEKTLKDIESKFNNTSQIYLTEDLLAIELKQRNLFNTRAIFWKYLIKKRVLFSEQKYVIVNSYLVDEKSELYEKKVDTFENCQKDAELAVILYDPVRNLEYLKEKGKLLFLKADFKECFEGNYKRNKRQFEFNKCAILDREKLIESLRSEFDFLNKEDFNSERIPQKDWDQLWQCLIDQKIIDSNGCCAVPISQCHLHEKEQCDILFAMKFQDCPMYEEAVNYIVKRKFVTHRVLHAFFHGQYDAINRLPLNPHCSMLFDLTSEGIVILPTVNKNIVDYKLTQNIFDSIDGLLQNLTGVQWNLLSDPFDECQSQLKKTFPEITNDDTRKAIESYLKSNRPAYVGLETVDASLKDLSKTLEGQKSHDSIATELYTLTLVGFDHLIELSEQKWSREMIARSVFIIALGVAQLVLGAIIEIKSVGFMTHVASGLMSEGVSDILFAMSALYSGNNFTWSDYGQHKLISVALTVATVGVGSCLSKGVNFYKYGYKLGGPALEISGKSAAQNVIKGLSVKTITKEVAKTTSLRIIKGVGMGLVNHAVENFVNNQLRSFCQGLANSLTGDLDKKISESGLEKKLGQLYRIKKEEAKSIFDKKVSRILFGSNWVNIFKNWMGRLISAFSQGLSNAIAKRQLNEEWQLLSLADKAKMILSKLKTAWDLLSSIKDLVSDNVTKLERELEVDLEEGDTSQVETDRERQFKEAAIKRLQEQVRQNAKQKVDELTTMVLQTASTFIVQQSAKYVKKQFNQWKEDQYTKEFEKEREKFRKEEKDPNVADEYSVDQSQKDAYHHKLLKLAAKTKNHKLIADMMSEGIPIDRFGAQAVKLAIKHIAKSQGIDIDKVNIKITTSDGQYSHVSPEAGSECIELTLERATKGNMGHYDCNSSEWGNDCVISAIEEQIQKMHPDKKLILDPKQVRKFAAYLVKNDPSISFAINQGWHRFTYQKGMFGGNKRFKSREDSEGRVDSYGKNQLFSKRGETNADHQPATSSWKHAKHDNIRNISRDQHPTMQIAEKNHKKTKNYGSPFTSNNKEFLAKQRALMETGQYHEAIWHAVETNWLDNFIMGMEDSNKRGKYLESVRKVFSAYYSLTKDTKFGDNSLIMTRTQLEDLNERLDDKIKNFRRQ